jgi:hypothetical protein
MSDLLGGGSGGGNGRSTNGGARAPSGPGPIPVQQQRPTGGLRTPRDIMNERQARERRQAEANRAAEEQRQQQLRNPEDERRRRNAEERVHAAGVAGRPPAQSRTEPAPTSDRPQANIGQPATYPGAGSSHVAGGPVNVTSPSRPQDVPAAGRARTSSQSQGQPRPVPPQSTTLPPTGTQRNPQSQSYARPAAEPGPSRTRPGPSTGNPPGAAPAGQSSTGAQQRSSTSTFPHAFERWETLSSHWEGLTSYWIRRLEQNTAETRDEPLVQQMSRQITDLSAAGANLFHAVVELQRLRASSERKFQRWFYETRQEQERAQEREAELMRQLEGSRQVQQDDSSRVSQAEREKRNAEKLVAEMRRELQISKEEARRAWEELGRREQEERERVLSLREGQPTLVGGVQVVPTTGGLSRHGTVSTRAAEEEAEQYYEGNQSPTDTDPFTERSRGAALRHEPDVTALGHTTYASAPTATTTTTTTTRTTLPTTESVPAPLRPHHAPAPSATSSAPTQPVFSEQSPPEHFYTHHGAGTYLHPQDNSDSTPQPTEGDARSYVPSVEASSQASENEVGEWLINDRGEWVRDEQGRRIPYQPRPGSADSDGDSYDVQQELDRERRLAEQYGVSGGYAYGGQTATSAGAQGGYGRYPPAADYSGSGYGGYAPYGSGVHYQLTRLSDVIEEDERSRTSPSRASQASREPNRRA